MPEPAKHAFDSREQFHAQLRLCLARAERTLQLLDPDFAAWPLGASDVTQALKRFLLSNGSNRVQLILHSPRHVQQHYPRFMELLADFSHGIECRITPANLRHLTDSFCIADQLHGVRRFHSAFFRGEASFGDAAALDVCQERFAALWEESRSGLHGSTLGL